MADKHPAAEAVAWASAVVGARVVSHRGLREGSSPWLLCFENGAEAVLRLVPAQYRSMQRTEIAALKIAALKIAARHRISTPRLLGADVDGLGAVLVTAIAGRSTIPVTATPGRLRTLGEAAAALHRVPLEPGPDLPQRTRPIEVVDFAAMRRETGTSDLLAEAEALIAQLPRPAGAVFVHGDLWQGNTLWSTDGTLLAVVDWDCAGSGHPGIDLGSLRCDAAIMYGVAAAEVISAGWSAVIGREPEHTAYWDAVAALSTPTDLGYFIDSFADQGRGDLGRATAIARRDAFLQNALTQLSRAA